MRQSAERRAGSHGFRAGHGVRGCLAVLVCVLAVGIASAPASAQEKPSADELWELYPLDPQAGKTGTEAERGSQAEPATPPAAEPATPPAAEPDVQPREQPKPATAPAPEESSGVPILPLALAVLGGLALLAVLIVIAVSVRRRRLAPERRWQAEWLARAWSAPRALADETQATGWLETEVAQARDSQRPLSLIVLSPDDRDPGSALFEELETTLAEELRDIDCALHRDETRLALVIRGARPEGARRLADRLRLFVPLESPGLEGEVTMSAGVASFPLHADTTEGLLAAAERALRMSATLGGNRTSVAPEPHQEALETEPESPTAAHGSR